MSHSHIQMWHSVANYPTTSISNGVGNSECDKKQPQDQRLRAKGRNTELKVS